MNLDKLLNGTRRMPRQDNPLFIMRGFGGSIKFNTKRDIPAGHATEMSIVLHPHLINNPYSRGVCSINPTFEYINYTFFTAGMR
jgi:hypothetical protein